MYKPKALLLVRNVREIKLFSTILVNTILILMKINVLENAKSSLQEPHLFVLSANRIDTWTITIVVLMDFTIMDLLANHLKLFLWIVKNGSTDSVPNACLKTDKKLIFLINLLVVLMDLSLLHPLYANQLLIFPIVFKLTPEFHAINAQLDIKMLLETV